MLQQDLFGPPPAPQRPEGLVYEPDFLDALEEAALLTWFAGLSFEQARYKAYEARRRVVSYGGRYDFDTNVLHDAPPVPAELHALRDRCAAWAKVPRDAFAHALVAEYAPGTPLGWHRDVPDFETVVGVSLGGPARMRLRPWPPDASRRADVIALDLDPRSVYRLTGAARWAWQHCIAPTPSLRYSITFRTRGRR